MTMIGKENLEVHGGNLRQARERYGERVVLDFSANINALGMADTVRAAIISDIEDIIHYPDSEAKALKQAVAQYYDVPVEQLVVGNGATELIYLLMQQLRPRKILLPAPTFSEYERAARSINGQILYFPLKQEEGFQINVQEMIKAIEDVEICFLCNPNNPVGTMLDRNTLEKIIQAAADRHVWIVIDESFIDFLPDAAAYTCSKLVSKYDKLIVLHSLTKFFALPGLRLGFGIMPETLAKSLDLSKDPWNVNSLAQAAGVAGLKDVMYIQKSIKLLQEEQRFMYTALNRINGLTAYKPTANFIFLRIEHPTYDARNLANATAHQGILIRDCSSYQGLDTGYVRVAIKRREDNLKLLALLERLLCL